MRPRAAVISTWRSRCVPCRPSTAEARGGPPRVVRRAGPNTKGERIAIEGRVIDGSGTPLRDVLIEICQADAAGRYDQRADPQPRSPGQDFRGWGRTGSDFSTGLFVFETIKPGPVVDPSGTVSAPHINVWIVARGINIGLNTRIYFSDI